MIDAMLNQISGSTIIAPYTDPLVRVDTSTPLCAEVKSAITTFAQIVEDTLEGGPDRIEVIPANENSSEIGLHLEHIQILIFYQIPN